MKSISMAYTTPSIVAKAKSKTRRNWNEKYAKSFKKGEKVEATSRQLRFGGERVAEIEVLEPPYVEEISDWTGKEDKLYVEEGFAFLEDRNIVPEHAPLLKLAHMWVESGGEYWVLPLNVTHVAKGMFEKYTTEIEMSKARNRLFESISGVKIKDITPIDAYIKQVA